MGWVMMSEREMRRIEILAQVDDGRLSVEAGANNLALSRRQMFRLLKRYRADGAVPSRISRNMPSPFRLGAHHASHYQHLVS